MRKKLNRFEIRILEQLRQAQHENPTATVVFQSSNKTQKDALVFLYQRGFVSPRGGKEVILTRQGAQFIQKWLVARKKETANA